MLTISPVQPADFQIVSGFLQKAGLPIADLPDGLPHFFKAEFNGSLVGTVGLELHRPYALLRSLAVAEDFRSQYIGQQLYAVALQYARDEKITQLYLITNTADRYFERQGFRRTDRALVPDAIRQTAQFAGLCPGSATVMQLTV